MTTAQTAVTTTRRRSTANASNVSAQHVPAKVVSELASLVETKDKVAVGPVHVLMTAGRDTVLSWPSTEDEKDRARRGGEVDWFRAEVDRSLWAQELSKQIDALKARPKNVVVDKEIQTLRQRLSNAASVLRTTRAFASKLMECEIAGFSVTLPDKDAMTRTIYPVTVIDGKKTGLPVQLNVRDFINLRPVKGRQATALEIAGARRERRAGRRTDRRAVTRMVNNAGTVAICLGVVADYITNHAADLCKNKQVMHEADNMRKALTALDAATVAKKAA